MTQNKKKISKSQEIRRQWIQRQLDTGASQGYIVEERPEREQTRIRVTAGGNQVQPNAGATRVTAGDGTSTVVYPVLYSLAYRKAWKKISDEHYNR